MAEYVNPLSNFEKMGKYACVDKLNYLNLLDSYRLKSNLTASQKAQLSFYETLKKQYLESGCGVDALKDTCLDLETKIGLMQSAIDVALRQGSSQPIQLSQQLLQQYKDDFVKKGCETKINELKTEQMNDILQGYQEQDKLRIQEQTKKMVRQRVVVGGVIVLLGLGIILIKRK